MSQLNEASALVIYCVTFVIITFLFTDCQKHSDSELTRQYIAGTNVLTGPFGPLP